MWLPWQSSPGLFTEFFKQEKSLVRKLALGNTRDIYRVESRSGEFLPLQGDLRRSLESIAQEYPKLDLKSEILQIQAAPWKPNPVQAFRIQRNPNNLTSTCKFLDRAFDLLNTTTEAASMASITQIGALRDIPSGILLLRDAVFFVLQTIKRNVQELGEINSQRLENFFQKRLPSLFPLDKPTVMLDKLVGFKSGDPWRHPSDERPRGTLVEYLFEKSSAQ